MKKKVLTVLLAVTMTATAGSPVCASDFTSGTAKTEEFSEGIEESEETQKPDIQEDEENATVLQETTEPVEENSESEEEKITDTEEMIDTEDDSLPEFDDGQDEGVADSAQQPVTSKKYPLMKRVEKGKYAVTVKNATENSYVKFVPDQTGKYVFKRTVTYKNEYTHKNETRTVQIYNLFDSKSKKVNGIVEPGVGYGCYELKKGKTYYVGCESGLKVILQGEILTDVASVKPVNLSNSVALYTPIDFNKSAWRSGNAYDVADRWKGNIKITYSDGKTETIPTYGVNKYGASVRCYIIYKGKKSSPEAGRYNVHFSIDGSKAEAVLKNVSVKKLSAMPTLNGSGKKTFKVGGKDVYVRFKTGKSTKYQVSLTFPDYNPGEWPIAIMQEKNGELKYAGNVQNGKTCTLKANTVYYLSVNLFSNWLANPTVTLKLTAKN